MNQQLILKQLERFATERWARRGIRSLIRTTWLGISLASFWLGGHLLFAWPMDYRLLQVAVLVSIAIGTLLLLRPRMNSPEVARRLDKRFGLSEQLMTATELATTLPAGSKPEGVTSHLLLHARQNSHQIHRYLREQQRFPWTELIALIATILMAIGLFLLIHLDQPGNYAMNAQPLLPPAGPGSPPNAFSDPPASGETGPPESDMGNEGMMGEGQAEQPASGSNQQAITALADALRDLSITRPVADALDQGDTNQAAQRLRELADQATRLPQETRADIASALRDAATTIGTTDASMANDIRDHAASINRDGQQAAQSLEDLAEMVEQMGNPSNGESSSPPPTTPDQQAPPSSWQDPPRSSAAGGAGNVSGNQRERPAEPKRLDAEGVPLELEGENRDGETTDGSQEEEPEPIVDGSGVGGFESDTTETTDSSVVPERSDPLRIPPEYRHVVQTYFSEK